MKKISVLLVILIVTTSYVFARQNQADSLKQFILIVRYNPKMQQPSKEVLAENIKHWNEFMGELGQNGQIVAGYRPSPEGITVTSKETRDGAYNSNNESVSSFLIIKAASMNAAEAIAKKCPVLEFDGSVEVRPLLMTN